MRKKIGSVLLLCMTLALSACGGGAEPPKEEANSFAEPIPGWEEGAQVQVEEIEEEPVEEVVEEEPAEEIPEGMYRSELTNEWIDESLKDQRPITVMVDNEKTALPHFGLNDADIVYEMMNSTKNGRITRLMPVVKDWAKIKQFGSIRSARPTNYLMTWEYDAVLCHDGGPFYIDVYNQQAQTNHFSGGFARFSNGKSAEFTEYLTYDSYTNSSKGKTYGGLKQRFESEKIATTYNNYYPGPHFTFSNTDQDLSTMNGAIPCNQIALPFPHTSSTLKYNDGNGTYDYYVYGKAHVDAGKNNETTNFKNLIIQSCKHTQLDENGYLLYDVVSSGEGWFISDGYAVPINWKKTGDINPTEFTYKSDGQPITLNTGKTYISLVPADSWGEVKID